MPARKLPNISILIADYQSGLSCGQIADKYKVSNESVVAKHLRNSGIQMRSQSEPKKIRFANGSLTPTAYWTGKKQSPEMVEKRISKIRGKRHYKYKDGESIREYRKLITKKQCELCETKKDLCIHHKDFNHFNNKQSNLQVLCKSCHISLHKTEYWRCKREGVEYKSNAPMGWERD